MCQQFEEENPKGTIRCVVNSTICGFAHTITGQLEGNKVIIDIDTPCEKIKEFSHMEVPTMEIFGIDDDNVIRKAKDAKCKYNSTCLIPCAVIHMCNLKAGFMQRKLADNSGSISISFKP